MVVVGGGDVAYDAGRTAFRCGAEHVTLACIEDERTAPASSEEVEEGKEEQVHVEYSLMPVAITGSDGVATGVRFQRCTLGEPNERGWRPPVPVEGAYVETRGRHGHLRRGPGDRGRLRSPAPTAWSSLTARSRSTPTP